MLLIFLIILLINLGIPVVKCQLNLGSFSLGQDKYGDLKFVFNQSANILGFGGDRMLDFTIGEGRFKTKVKHGTLIGGHRIGADSNFGLNEAEGVDIKNSLNFDSVPISFANPAGQLISLLNGVKNFFINTAKPPYTTQSSIKYENPEIIRSRRILHGPTEKQEISGKAMKYIESETDDDFNNYYHNVKVENDKVTQQEFNTTGESIDEEDMDLILN